MTEDVEVTNEELEALYAPTTLHGLDALRAMAIEKIEGSWFELISQFENPSEAEGLEHSLKFHGAIWDASTKILPNLEVQVVVDAENQIFVSTGSAGYVDFNINPIRAGMKTPVKCWIHTHPFGVAYFSGTDIRTVRIWKPLMETAYVLGGHRHYGFWHNAEPNQLEIYKDDLQEIQRWGNLEEEE